ncbi:hypothetical protein GXM_01458 [Nostoc sphaeroides CCNUC1]|uniref:Uncharacterized protein n=1 Tax=Nostoc sphaeroides CCNUC1 TaxID=2653204 RepID=A0A5P8VU67_9NOSO|nr:hypothetical protein GXM_01458 [Nostoc sphaeroides CCNUC1]
MCQSCSFWQNWDAPSLQGFIPLNLKKFGFRGMIIVIFDMGWAS